MYEGRFGRIELAHRPQISKHAASNSTPESISVDIRHADILPRGKQARRSDRQIATSIAG
jgi:hypothetical protein